MKTYRMNVVMAGVLYFMGTAFGVTGTIVGGDNFSLPNLQRRQRRTGDGNVALPWGIRGSHVFYFDN